MYNFMYNLFCNKVCAPTKKSDAADTYMYVQHWLHVYVRTVGNTGCTSNAAHCRPFWFDSNVPVPPDTTVTVIVWHRPTSHIQVSSLGFSCVQRESNLKSVLPVFAGVTSHTDPDQSEGIKSPGSPVQIIKCCAHTHSNTRLQNYTTEMQPRRQPRVLKLKIPPQLGHSEVKRPHWTKLRSSVWTSTNE